MNERTNDFIEVTANYRTVHVSTHPVSLPEFRAFLEDAGRDLPEGVKHAPSNLPDAPEPVVGVSQVDAAAYCEWACKRAGRTCRLPSTDELDALMPHTMVTHQHGEEVPDAGFWPHEKGSLPEIRGGLRPVFLCEWTREIDDTSNRDRDRIMALIFYPPWLREGNNPLHAHAALLASESYSFVTFRVSYEG